MHCAKCGTKNPTGKKFCGDCGTPLANRCPKCTAENPPAKQFCGECGTVLSGHHSPTSSASDAQHFSAARITAQETDEIKVPSKSGAKRRTSRATAVRRGQMVTATADAGSHQMRAWIRGTLIRRRILGVVLAFAVFSGLAFLYVYFIKPPSRTITPNEFIRTGAASIATLISSTASLFGMVDKRHDKAPPTHSHLAASFKSGLYGGVIGGALAGLIIGVIYFIGARNEGVNWERIPIVFAFASAAGTLFGASIQGGILVFSRIPTSHYSALAINEVTGGIVGGILGGLFAGALGGPLFYSMSGPVVSMPLLLGGSAMGGFCVVLGTLVYDYGGLWRDILPAMFASAIITAFPVGIGFYALSYWQTHQGLLPSMDPMVFMLVLGAAIGLAVGATLGMEVGLTLRMFSSMKPKSEDEI